MADESDGIAPGLLETVKAAIGKEIELEFVKKVKFESKGERTETRVLSLSGHRLYVMLITKTGAKDVDTIYLSHTSKEFKLQDFDHLDQKDLVPLISTLEYDDWFTKVNCTSCKLISDVCDAILRVVKKSTSIEELVLDGISLNRDLPRALMIGIPLVTVCYLLVNIAYIAVVGQHGILTSGAVAMVVGDSKLGPVSWFIPIFVACSTFGCVNGLAFSGASIAFIMLIPESSSFSTLVNYFSFAAWLSYLAVVVALLYLRWKRPNAHRPYKVWLFVPILVVLAALYLLITPFTLAPLECSLALIFVVCGIPVYFLCCYTKVAEKCCGSVIDKLTYNAQSICNFCLEETQDTAEIIFED